MPYMPGNTLLTRTVLQGSDPLKKRRSAPAEKKEEDASKPSLFSRISAWFKK